MFATCQVVSKSVPMELVLRDQDITELYVLDKITRGAVHSLFRAILTQLDPLVDDHVRRGR